MARPKSEISPEEIRAIREGLCLSQVEAGDLLGGGPRAFTKYENGSVKPAASVVNLLLLLEANPGALSTLTGHKSTPFGASGTRPGQVTGRHIAELRERPFAELLRKLLAAEVQANGIPADGVHVASSITTPDGGEDGRIMWKGGPERTAYLPARLSQFQLKAGKITLAAAAQDVLTNMGTVKEMVKEVLEEGGVYTMLCSHPYVRKDIAERAKRIREALTAAGLTTEPEQVAFRDADQIAQWVNEHPSVATWVLEQTQPGMLGPFRTWNHWAGRSEHDGSPWVDDPRLLELRTQLRDSSWEPRGVARVVGHSGVGKSRLTLEALAPTEEEETSGCRLSDLVLYAVESEVGSMEVKKATQNLADSGMRAVVVVDRCPAETHQDLKAMVKRSSSRLSLITIDDEIPSGPLAGETFKVDEAPSAVTEGMINQMTPGLPSEDQRRLVHFSKGYPKIAVLLVQSWGDQIPVPFATDETLVDDIVFGRKLRNSGRLRDAAMLLSTFGLVGAKPPIDVELAEIADLSRSLSDADLRAAIEDLARRGVAQRRGRAVILQPRPIALWLAERQWREWGHADWERVLTGNIPSELKVRAARQLALLNRTDVAIEVVGHVCRAAGPLSTLEAISQPQHTEVISALSEIDTSIVASLLERVLHDVDLAIVGGNVRRHLVRALEKIAFVGSTFEEGARLLLRFAADENETWGNNATGQFKSLFPVVLGATEADGGARLYVLREVLDTDNDAERLIVVDALLTGAQINLFSRSVGAETHGARPALESWQPKTSKEAWFYVEACVDMLLEIVSRDDEAGARARTGLGQNLGAFVGRGRIEMVERVVCTVRSNCGRYWPEALESLGALLARNGSGLDADKEVRVKALTADLQPDAMADRVRQIVTEMAWDYPSDEKLDYNVLGERQREAVYNLAQELVTQPDTLKEFLPGLSTGRHRMAADFGQAIAELSDAPLDWLDPIADAVAAAPADERSYDLLAGYLVGIAKAAPEVMRSFKEKAATSAEFAPALPLICWRLNIVHTDIPLVCGALRAGLLEPWRLMQWTLGGALATVSAQVVVPLLDLMLELNAEAYSVALNLLDLRAHSTPEKLDELRPQLRKVAEGATRWPRSRASQMDGHHFQQLMEWVLKKGREDPDARAIALTLTRGLVAAVDWDYEPLTQPLVPLLLAEFPEIVWPLIGHAIVSDRGRAWRFEHVLGDRLSFGEQRKPTILRLPEDTLFAWCHAHPQSAPAFVAAVVPVLTTQDLEAPGRVLHPLVRRLLDEFGDQEGVLGALFQNLHNFGWRGSLTTYYALYVEPLTELLTHPIARVRRWAKRTLAQLDMDIAAARSEDEEREAQWEI